MRRSPLSLSLASACAAAVLAACSGSGVVPSQQMPLAPFLPDTARSQSACSKVPHIWDFHGSCTRGSFGSSGATISLKPYAGVTLNFGLAKNGASSSVGYAAADATGKKDVTGTFGGKSFAPYGAKSCRNGLTCRGTSLIYFSFYQSGGPIAMRANSSIEVVSRTFAGSVCAVVLWTSAGWEPLSSTQAPKSGKKITFSSIPILALAAGATFMDIACY
jgi:hypothetical protein